MSNFQFNFFKTGNDIMDEEKKSNTTFDEKKNFSEKDSYVPCEELKIENFYNLRKYESEPVEGFPSLLKRKYFDILSDLKNDSSILKITEESDL